MDRRSSDRPRGLVVAPGSGDLIGDIHRQNRRRVLKRAAQITALGVGLLLTGIGLKVMADRRDQSQAVERVEQQVLAGTVSDLYGAIELAEHGLQKHPEHAPLLTIRGLMRAHLWAEFGAEQDAARVAVAAMVEPGAQAIAEGMLAFADADLDAAAAAADAVLGEDASALERAEQAWLRGSIAAALAEAEPERLEAAIAELAAVIESNEAGVAHRRVHAYLLLLADRPDEALAALAAARERSRSHFGLAADEALFNAHLRQELGGVASVADQLLAMAPHALSPRDRAHAQLSRAVAHVAAGEPKDALTQLDAAWEGLSSWNMLARRMAVQTTLEAGNTDRLDTWLEASAFGEDEKSIFRAWARLTEGEVMKSLRLLEKAPQAHPYVGCLQALALVEQGRWAEAQPWIERSTRLLPGRHDVEVAAARVDLRLGDKQLALRRLEALAEQEAHAPRALTGLGEAHLLQEGDAKSDKKAKRALEKAIEREAVPAEAQYLLSGIWHRRRADDAEAEPKALALLEAAAATNPSLPRYQEALSMYLADLGYTARSLTLMAELEDKPGIGWALTLRRARMLTERDGASQDTVVRALIEKAKEQGAPPAALARETARADLRLGTKEAVQSAQVSLQALLGQTPADADAHVLYAMTFLKQFDRKAADAAVRRGLGAVAEEDSGLLRLARAKISVRAGRSKQAAPMARVAWARILAEPTRTTAELLDAGDLATRLWTRANKDAVALRIARELTTRLAFHADAWTIRARAELAANEAAAARTSADKAISLDAENPAGHEIRGHCLLRFGDKKRARAAYDKAISLAKTPAEKNAYRANLKRL